MSENRDADRRVAAVARALLDQPDLATTVRQVVEAAAATLGPEVYASVSLLGAGHRVETPAASDERANRADELQNELREGPCLAAIDGRTTVLIDDLTTEQRYPGWAHEVAEQTGIRSSLSVRLSTGDGRNSLGSLNLYSPRPRAFDDATCSLAEVLAAPAALAVRCQQERQQLRAAMATRNVIGQAQGVLMERLKITPDEAFGILSRLSQETNTKLRDVARRVAETGEVVGR